MVGGPNELRSIAAPLQGSLHHLDPEGLAHDQLEPPARQPHLYEAEDHETSSVPLGFAR